MMKSEESSNMSQQIIEQIQDMIITGQLSKGDKLPPERQLTEMMGVSRPALREVLKALEILGLIERKQGYGNVIAGDMDQSLFKPLSLFFILNKGPAQDILDLRYVLEEFCVKQACLHATAHDIKNLLRIMDEMTNADSSVADKARLDREFHYEIARTSDNQLIISIMENIRYLMDVIFDVTTQSCHYEGKDMEIIYGEHMKLIEQIRNGDQEGAVATMRQHLSPIDLKILRQNAKL